MRSTTCSSTLMLFSAMNSRTGLLVIDTGCIYSFMPASQVGRPNYKPSGAALASAGRLARRAAAIGRGAAAGDLVRLARERAGGSGATRLAAQCPLGSAAAAAGKR